MDYLSNYKSKLLGGSENDDNNYQDSSRLDTSLNKSVSDLGDFDGVFGEEVKRKDSDPSRGRKYLLFSFLMVILLSLQVIMHSSSQEIAKMAEQNAKQQQESIYKPTNTSEPAQPAETKEPAEPETPTTPVQPTDNSTSTTDAASTNSTSGTEPAPSETTESGEAKPAPVTEDTTIKANSTDESATTEGKEAEAPVEESG
uniref:Uncharacterized protein n=1 Tax=Strombidium rassoulzadegani TaxID=1082188 RepID=A0A7S3FWK3_9SPIT|mmetsp:Transcript_4154/g.7035  ORF Transcript_4154/g.7035 Transcript_4154/m.7035 type:complete len:200 (+) Transcript_4154:24-623(+)